MNTRKESAQQSGFQAGEALAGPQYVAILQMDRRIVAIRLQKNNCGHLVYIDGSLSSTTADLLYGAPPVTDSSSLNLVTASHAVALIRALLPGAPPWKTSVPGAFGLPGGWPVRIEEGNMRLNLPEDLTVTAGEHCQSEAAKFDGIQDIAVDGTVTFTENACSALRQVSHELAAPMHPDDALPRHAKLLNVLR